MGEKVDESSLHGQTIDRDTVSQYPALVVRLKFFQNNLACEGFTSLLLSVH